MMLSANKSASPALCWCSRCFVKNKLYKPEWTCSDLPTIIMGPLSQVLVSWCTISSGLMKCKPEIWETESGPDEYGWWPRSIMESSILMLLSMRSVRVAVALLSLSALHEVVDGRVWLWESRSRSCNVSPRTNKRKTRLHLNSRWPSGLSVFPRCWVSAIGEFGISLQALSVRLPLHHLSFHEHSICCSYPTELSSLLLVA